MNSDSFNQQLNRGSASTLVFFDGVADVEWLALLNIVEIFRHIKANAIHNLIALTIYQLKLDMLHFATNNFAGTEIKHITSEEHWFCVVGTEWVEQAQRFEQFRINLVEIELTIQIDLRRNLLKFDMRLHVFGEAATEFPDILHFHRKAHCIGAGHRKFREGRGFH